MKIWKCKCGEVNEEQVDFCLKCGHLRTDEIIVEKLPESQEDKIPDQLSIPEKTNIIFKYFEIPKPVTFAFLAGVAAFYLSLYVFYKMFSLFTPKTSLTPWAVVLTELLCLEALMFAFRKKKDFLCGIYNGFRLSILLIFLLLLLLFGSCTYVFLNYGCSG
ncbi:MAG: hypothetical protein PHW04_00735 [Candidatus Wallbacteria bacterium]|nr:hypothetical protein [Candidatus Wallbacteria bacterium]